MPKIKILPHEELCPDGAEIEATVGKSVCENLLNSSIDIEHACELSCACTTCHVIFREGFDSLNESTDDEEDLLDKAWGLEPKSRLSCQTIVDEHDLTIEIPKYTINMVSENHPKKENKNSDMEKTLTKKDFSLSDSALSHISSLLKQNNSSGVRVSVKTSGCSGYAYDLSYIEIAEKDDYVLNIEDVNLYISKESFIFLKGTKIDYVKKGLNSELIFINPNISAKCGCGESFSVDQNLFQQA
tara:strand:- start:5705 stop:6433 length:729 start_codon:yes stop_codon:yes gene_type:complete